MCVFARACGAGGAQSLAALSVGGFTPAAFGAPFYVVRGAYIHRYPALAVINGDGDVWTPYGPQGFISGWVPPADPGGP